MPRVFLDHNATTPVAAAVAEQVARALRDTWGNASSVHHFGQQAKAALDTARSAVADLIGADAAQITFTSGGTESNNLALRGTADALEVRGRRQLITSGIEHEAVLNTAKALGRRGWTLTVLPAGPDGLVTPESLREALTDDTALVSVMHANNETGVIQPIQALAALAHQRGALFHTDAVQTIGKVPVDVASLGVDLLSLTAHKFYGPKGAGALWVRRGLRLVPTQTGGRQERNRRAGTENVPAIAGFGAAALLVRDQIAEGARIGALRDRLEREVLRRVPRSAVNGTAPRVPNTTNISVEGTESESLLIGLDLEGIAISAGSACSSGTLEPSHVLKAMGLPHTRALSSLRFSLGIGTTEAEIDHVLRVLPGLVEKLRGLSSVPTRR